MKLLISSVQSTDKILTKFVFNIYFGLKYNHKNQF